MPKQSRDQLASIGLVMEHAELEEGIDHLKAGGLDVRYEDFARLTPLDVDYTRLLGECDFTLRTGAVASGLRPLHRARSPKTCLGGEPLSCSWAKIVKANIMLEQ
jgi:hypothetical protein